MSVLKCAHCKREFSSQDALYFKGEVTGALKEKAFCCNGCLMVYRLINEEGLGDFYRKLESDATLAGTLLRPETTEFSEASHIVEFEEGVRQVGGSVRETDIYIDRIRCASCVWLNEKAIGKLEGVLEVRVNYGNHKARIRWDNARVSLREILGRIVSIGYRPIPYSEDERFRAQSSEKRDLLIRFGTAAFLSTQLMLYSTALYAGYFQGMDAGLKLFFRIIAMGLCTPVVFYCGFPFIRAALGGLRHGYTGMDSLVAMGSLSAYSFSVWQIFKGRDVYFDTAAMIITLVTLGRYIEISARARASQSIRRLTELFPREARVAAAADRVMVPIKRVLVGQNVEVRPGERIALDGIVVSGTSQVDESLLTGEAKPVSKNSGSAVIGGTLNLYGTFVFQVTKTEKDTVLSKIIKAVEDAQASKPKIQGLADRFVGHFVKVIFVVAVATVCCRLTIFGDVMEHALMSGISVAVIACPCALGLATPLAILAFTSAMSDMGILIKSGDIIEKAAKIRSVFFDKTGTITTGKMALRKIIPIDKSIDQHDALGIAASLERMSEHSIGKAIADAAGMNGRLPVESFTVVPAGGVAGVVAGRHIRLGSLAFIESGIKAGRGVSGKNIACGFADDVADTPVYMSINGTPVAVFVISDALRAESASVATDLSAMGVDVSVISGDTRAVVESVARSVGVKNAVWEASPVDKKRIVDDVQASGRPVLMVGDGINDAPALSAASVGLAVAGGTDVTMESAGVVLTGSDLNRIPYFMRLSGKTYSIMKENVFWAIFYNLLAVPMAASGVLHPIVAACAMVASSVFVVTNSLRINRISRGFVNEILLKESVESPVLLNAAREA